MSEHLKYTKQSKKRAFADAYFGSKFADVNNMTPAQQTGIFYKKANEHRNWFKPIFVNETQYLPNLKASDVISDYSQSLDVKNGVSSSSFKSNSTESLTIPPDKQNENILLKALVIGAGIYLVYNIIEE